MSELYDHAGRDAAILSATEVGLGSVLHGMNIPLAGHVLSLNQSFLLTRSVLAAKKNPWSRGLPVTVSNVTALLKTLAPAGKKLTPMLAISIQGLLYGFGTLLFGPNIFGAFVGSIVASAWGFLQPLLIAYIFFGSTFFQAISILEKKLHEAFSFAPENIWSVLVGLILLKCILAAMLVIVAAYLPSNTFELYVARLARVAVRKSKKINDRGPEKALGHNAKLAAGDLLNPLFVFSIILSGVFLYFSESSHARIIWALLRPIAIAYLLFLAIRIMPIDRLSFRLERSGYQNLSKAIQVALETMRK